MFKFIPWLKNSLKDSEIFLKVFLQSGLQLPITNVIDVPWLIVSGKRKFCFCLLSKNLKKCEF